MKSIWTNLLLLLTYFFLSLGVFFGGAKFHVPWYGANDFSDYYRMVEKPFDNTTGAPYAYRILTPTVAHYVEKYRLFYSPALTPYKDNYLEHDGVSYLPSTLGAVIFTNFLFLILAAFFTSKTISHMTPDADLQSRMLAIGLPSLIFLSFSTIVHGYAGLTEGGTLFFVSLLAYLMQRDRLVLFGLFVFLGVLQRELVPLTIFVFALASPSSPNKNKYLALSLAAFASYFLLRMAVPVAGYEEQVSPSSLAANFTSFNLTKDFFFQSILANNLVFFAIFAALLLGLRSVKVFLPYIAVMICLAALGVGEAIGNNVGRILNIATPLLVLCIARAYANPAKGLIQDSRLR